MIPLSSSAMAVPVPPSAQGIAEELRQPSSKNIFAVSIACPRSGLVEWLLTHSRFAQQKLPVQRRAPAFTVTLLRQERRMDVTLFNRMLPHLKSCGMDEQAIARARESWAAAWEHDRRGLPCPFCSGQGRKGFAAAGFSEDNVNAAELMKCKSCGNVIPLDTR
jgi:hypothetical protein